MTTGQGTPVGTGTGRYVNLPAVSPSTGEVFAWSQGPASPFRFIRIDKITGVASLVGNSGIQTNAHSLVFDSTNTLYLLNNGGNLYTINTANAAGLFARQQEAARRSRVGLYEEQARLAKAREGAGVSRLGVSAGWV